jgi:hypothetical protein
VINSNFLKPQEPNSFDIKKFESEASSEPMSNRETGGRFAPTAIRLRAIRRASLYPEPTRFCKFLGISFSRLSNVENGTPIGRGLQDIIIAKMPWISRSYLMDGSEDALTGFTLQKLAPLIAEESDTTRPRSRSRSTSTSDSDR